MLRRLPTPLTITPDDLASLEETLARRLAYIHYRKTGEDPDGLFTDPAAHGENRQSQYHQQQQAVEVEREKPVDPNDELKPLPGDRGRGGARGAQERIMGVPGARGR